MAEIQANESIDQVLNELSVRFPDLALHVRELYRAIDESKFNKLGDLGTDLCKRAWDMKFISIEVDAGLDNFLTYMKQRTGVACVESGRNVEEDETIEVVMSKEDKELSKPRFKRRLKEFALLTLWARGSIGNLAKTYIKENDIILVHGFSEAVLEVFKVLKMKKKKSITVFCTDGSPDRNGIRFQVALQALGISAHFLHDTAVASKMKDVGVEMVLVGANMVDENGGVIGQIGTFQISVLAKDANVKFYVVAESFKFSEPRSYYDHDRYDYTPPDNIFKIITDSGVLRPTEILQTYERLYTQRMFPFLAEV